MANKTGILQRAAAGLYLFRNAHDVFVLRTGASDGAAGGAGGRIAADLARGRLQLWRSPVAPLRLSSSLVAWVAA